MRRAFDAPRPVSRFHKWENNLAITSTHYDLFRRLPLPRGGTLLEIGEANWYGDIDPAKIGEDYPEAVDAVAQAVASRNWFNVAKAMYRAVFDPSENDAIDFNGSPTAVRHDLNQPLVDDKLWPPQYGVIINHGTAEHIFNIAQVFRTMHDACAVGGLMVHDAPFRGWLDHGFYCLQPTLFFDLAAANNYELVTIAAHDFRSGQVIRIEGREIGGYIFPDECHLFVCFRKLFEQPFKIPMQGYYTRKGAA